METFVKMGSVVLAGVVLLGTMAAAAEASSTSANASGADVIYARCAKSQFVGQLWAKYTPGANGKKNFYRFDWSVTGPGIRNKNNVRIGFATIPPAGNRAGNLFWKWSSKDNVRPGLGSYTPPKPVVVTPPNGGDTVQALAYFIFDRPGKDPRCSAEIANIF